MIYVIGSEMIPEAHGSAANLYLNAFLKHE